MEIKIEDLGKRFQQGWIFRKLNATYFTNQVLGIAGRNGSGKSTLLSVISGLLSPSEGGIRYTHQNREIPRSAIYQYIQVAAPYMELIEEYTLQELLTFHTLFKPSSQLKSVQDWLAFMELESAANRPLSQYSSGMKQRVRLALALYCDSEIVLLDEPTSNLDEGAKKWFFQHLEQQKANKLVIIASNESEDFQFCTEYIKLN